jgi:hypothetical protein
MTERTAMNLNPSISGTKLPVLVIRRNEFNVILCKIALQRYLALK